MSRYIIAVDQSTSSSKAFLLDETGEIIRRASRRHAQHYPQAGHVEHDAGEILDNVVQVIGEVTESVLSEDIAALALTNQRETVVLWDRQTGLPVAPAIVWQDVRAQAQVKALGAHAEAIRVRTGLALSAYYSAAKVMALLETEQTLASRVAAGEICIGTVDSYLLYRLTGGKRFATDVSNASRTQLMNLHTLAWDAELLTLFRIPRHALAEEILMSDAAFGTTDCPGIPRGIPIRGIMGDSHAALYGQRCFTPGSAKATYGTGSSVMMNTGSKPVLSGSGLSTSVAFGCDGAVHYALEGNVTCSGDTLCWLQDGLGLLSNLADCEYIATTVADTGGVVLVPAFSGLGAPHFAEGARGMICGLQRGTTDAHVIRAALEAIAHQNADILDAMHADTGLRVKRLAADGGSMQNTLLMQTQADFAQCQVVCAPHDALSAIGAAYMAGIATGMYPAIDALAAYRTAGRVFSPALPEAEYARKRDEWQRAVRSVRTFSA